MKKSNNSQGVLVSVIIPTFNRLSYLYPTLVCLLGQKVNFNYEIVIVDSGKDNTKEYVKELRKVYKNIKYRKIKYCKNRSLLRNIGVSISTGEILVFLDNDMLCPPDFLQYHYDKLNI